MTHEDDGLEVLSFGEALVDFLPGRMGLKLREVETYTRCLGGAPSNLAYGVGRLGGRAAFVGQVGEDEFGHFLREALQAAGVDVRGLKHTKQARTGIVFVEIDADGERSFMFYRHPSADMTIGPDDINQQVVRESAIVHSGTNLMSMPGPRGATFRVLDTAREAGRLVSLDANIRHHHWADQSQIRPTLMELMRRVDLLKANEDEFLYLFGEDAPRVAFDRDLAPLGVGAVLLTLGGGGATVITPTMEVHVEAPEVEVVDTTGAGDAFLAGALRALSLILTPCGRAPGAWRRGMDAMDAGAWRRVLGVANHMGAVACTRFGATTAMPTAVEVPWERWGFEVAEAQAT